VSFWFYTICFMDLFTADFKQLKKPVLKMSVGNLTFLSTDAVVDFLP